MIIPIQEHSSSRLEPYGRNEPILLLLPRSWSRPRCAARRRKLRQKFCLILVLRIHLFHLDWLIKLGLDIESLDAPLCVGIPMGSKVRFGSICRNCSLSIWESSVEFDLIVMDMGVYDLILGMNWLITFRVVIEPREQWSFFGWLASIVAREDGESQPHNLTIVREFLDVFPYNLSGLPPHQGVDFVVDIISY